MSERTIKVDMLARVEGEGAFKVVVENGRVTGTEFRIFEPPRFFEAFLVGRDHNEAPDITARICGICPVAYQMSSVAAMEMALGVSVDGPLNDLRRLLYCGEWIESHVLHAAMLHAPDFLGYAGAIEMAQDGHAETVKLALELKKAGNAIVTTVGGREIHPLNVRVGGWYRAPRKAELAPLRKQLVAAQPLAEAFLGWVAEFSFPDKERDYTLVSLKHPTDYPMHEGRIVSNRGSTSRSRRSTITSTRSMSSAPMHCMVTLTKAALTSADRWHATTCVMISFPSGPRLLRSGQGWGTRVTIPTSRSSSAQSRPFTRLKRRSG